MGRISSSLSSSNVSYCARKERSGASAQQRERGISEANNRPLAQLRLRRFFGLFWPIFDSFCGGSIRSLIQPPQNESKTRLKRTQKSTEAKLRKRSILKTEVKGPLRLIGDIAMFNTTRLLPMAPAIPLIKYTAEEGREVPKELQLIDSVGSGMVAGIGYAFPLFGRDLLSAAKTQYPLQNPSQAVTQFVRRMGPQQIGSAFTDCCAHTFSRGAILGGGFFVLDQGYKAYKKHSEKNQG